MQKNKLLKITFFLLRLIGTTYENDALLLKIFVKVCHIIAFFNTTFFITLAIINLNYVEGIMILPNSVELIMSYYMVISF